MTMSWSLRVAEMLLATVLLLVRTTSAEEVVLNGHRFSIPDGFSIEQVTTTDLVERPITADFDEQGHLYVADSSGSNDPVQQQLKDPTHRIIRLTDSDGDGRYDRKTLFADRVMFPEGTMWFDGSLYVSAPPSIWKFTDRDGDGVAEERSEWFQGKTLTGCANDLHGPYLGPDGWIYWCKGAFAEQTYDRPGGKPPLVTKASHIFRCRPDGSKIESVMTGGMDNPVDVAFLPTGERFLTTTFFQMPAGGFRDGLIHAVYGGLFGKVHSVLDGHPRTFPDVLPVFDHLGPAAPCGLHRLESAAWDEPYRDNLFAACFNLKKVTRHKVVEAGGSFRSETSDFVVSDNIDFHPTDVLEDADGSLLIVDTGGWYKLCCPTSQLSKPDVLGAIYRVRPKGLDVAADPRGLQLDWKAPSPVELAKRLTDSRSAVRLRARQAFRTTGDAGTAALASLAPKSPAAAGEAVWAASWIDQPAARAFVRGHLHHADPSVQRIALHVAGAWKDTEARADIARLLKSPSPAVRRAAAETLAQCGDGSSTEPLLTSLASVAAEDWGTIHAHTLALMECGDLPQMLAALPGAAPTVQRSLLMAIEQRAPEQLPPDVVITLLSASDTSLRDAARWVVARHPEWGPQLVARYSAQLRRRDLSDADAANLVRDMAALCPSTSIQKLLADLLIDSTVEPKTHDLVLRIMVAAGLKPAPTPWIDAVVTALGRGPDRIGPSLEAVRSLTTSKDQIGRVADALRAVAANSAATPALRLEALASIPGGSGPVAADLFELAVSSAAGDDASARSWAVRLLGAAALSPEQKKKAIPLFHEATPLELDRLVGLYGGTTDDALALAVLKGAEAAESFRSLRGDALRATFAKCGPTVVVEIDRLTEKLNADYAVQKARLETTLASLTQAGGDVRRGQLVFTNQKLACTGCHAIGYRGGKIGPDLTRIGQVRTERDLLEAILFPSASFVRSYEPMLIVTVDGLTHSGLVKSETPDEIVLTVKPDQEVRVSRSQIEEIRPGTVSIMPAGLDQQLSQQDLADLVAFLKACR